MPTYLHTEVTDEYLQGLIAAYREGYATVDQNVEDGDQPIIEQLEANKILTQLGARELGVTDAHAQAE
jgi:hypothetical protein